MTAELPAGFTLDQPQAVPQQAQLPEGFTLDAEPQAQPPQQEVSASQIQPGNEPLTEDYVRKKARQKLQGELPDIGELIKEPTTQAEMIAKMSGINAKPTGEQFIRPILEVGGAVAGGTIGSGIPGWGTVAGGALGYAGGKNLADILYETDLPEDTKQAILKTAEDTATGLTMELAGPVIGKTVGAIAKPVMKPIKAIIKQTLGATTGAGPGMIDEAIKGGREFKAAMRGQRTGQEVVDTAFDALQRLKNKRAYDYQKKLVEISDIEDAIDVQPIRKTLAKLMKQYNIKLSPEGALDFSRIAMGKKGRADIEDVVEIVSQWGAKEGDNTAIGLDVLKRQLDDFYSDSSQARGFVQTLKNAVKKTISKEVPQYAEMTSNYNKASNMIQDIESNLMMRKQGISGRITPDQTLRRLSSSMRENFELRKELVDVLGREGGEDLIGQVGGYTAAQWMPRGLVGKLASGGFGALALINPYYLPLLASSSPRAVGEFLSLYGQGLRQIHKGNPAILKTITYKSAKAYEDFIKENPDILNELSKVPDLAGIENKYNNNELNDKQKAAYEELKRRGKI